MRPNLLIPLLPLALACGNGLSSDEEAELAYIGLDRAVERAMDLGLKGFNEASSANIPPQSDEGEVSGTMDVTGQADQGASANKGLRLRVALEDYADLADVDGDEESEVAITYDTDPEAAESDLPYLQMSLRGIPDGDFTGGFDGLFFMSGDLGGDVTLELDLAGDIEEGESSGEVERVPGTIEVTGTATTDSGGVYTIDLTI